MNTLSTTSSIAPAAQASGSGLLRRVGAMLRRAFELAGAPYADGNVAPM